MALARYRWLGMTACLLPWIMASAEVPSAVADEDVLTRTVTALDAQLFGAYNRCDLDAFAKLIEPGVEFYHDKGGVTWGRAALVESIRENICHKLRRELIASTLKIYPIKGYGAIEEGEHRFCRIGTGKCDGMGRFLMVWRHQADAWQLARVVSYDHHPVE